MKLVIGMMAAAVSFMACNQVEELKESPFDRYKAVLAIPPAHVPTTKTPDGALAGNGDIGITLGGTTDSLCLYIGKNDFWRAYPVYPGGIALPGGLDLCAEGMSEACYLVEQLPGSAEIRGRFMKGDTLLQMKAWVAATCNHVVVELESNTPMTVNARLWAAEGNTSVTDSGNGKVAWVTRSFADTPMLQWETHVALAMNVLGKEQLETQESCVLLPHRKQYITVTAYTNHDTPQWKEKCLEESASLTEASLQKIRKEHDAWWTDFWNQSSVCIPDKDLERYYYVSQYLLACASRGDKFAPGIWGPFITRDQAAWGGDYHLNYNYQAPYWAAFSSNHIDLTRNFDQPLLDYMEAGRKHARELLDCDGIYYPVGIGPKGMCTTLWPLTPEEMLEKYGTRENTIDNGYKFLGQKINAVFSVGNMLMRFYSTYDEAYARKVYPYMRACADFWEDYLKEEGGRYVIEMDHFNEVMPRLRTNGQWKHLLGDFNSTLSLGLVRMLFKGIMDVSDFLQMDREHWNKWQDILNRLSDYPTGPDDTGRISLKNMERGPQGREVKPSGLNRVSIHGLILPGGVAGPITDSVFNAMLLADVDRWVDKMRQPDDWGNTLNNGIETCYPAAVRVGYPAEEVLEHLKKRILLSVHSNLWITQGGGGIETLAAVPLTINEMLMQSYEGVIRIFPNWQMDKDASFKKLRAYGAFLVSADLKKGVIGTVEIISEKGRPCAMVNPWKGSRVQLWRNGKKAEILNGDRFLIDTKEGETLMLKNI